MNRISVLSVRQPFASLIVSGVKPIENRTWPTNYRGDLFIHAAAKFHALTFAQIEKRFAAFNRVQEWPRGGIIGKVTLVDVVTASQSEWFEGPFGWVFENPAVVPFIPMHGQQQIFSVTI